MSGDLDKIQDDIRVELERLEEKIEALKKYLEKKPKEKREVKKSNGPFVVPIDFG